MKKVCTAFPLVISLGLLSFASDSEVREPWDIPQLSQPPKIDGVLENPLWEREALRIDGFLQLTPAEKGPPSEKTVAYIGHDRKNFYVAFRCYDSEPEKLRASITNRDNILEDDWILIFLDTFNEKRRAYTFMVNPFGIQMDMLRMEEAGSDDMDASWDTIFYSDGTVEEEGYVVELSIPFKSVRFPDREEKVWRLCLGRTIARTGEIIVWPPMSRSIPGLLTQGKEIKISGEVEKGKNFELMPIFTSLKSKGDRIDPQPGANFKWGISSDLTLDLTLNPDFSQIEADAPQVEFNQRFALYYTEKRPFFLEGMEIFRFSEIQMVYTRRISDPIAGAKLTGKIGRFTYGLLSALDVHPVGSLWDVSNGDSHRDESALFNIVRVKTDILKESYIGFSLTDRESNGSYNRVAGIDGQLKFGNCFFFRFQAIGSKTRCDGEESDIVPALFGEFNYYSKFWGGGLYWISIHPDFEAASGFVNRVDFNSAGAYTFVTIYPEKKYLNQIRFNLRGGRRYGFRMDVLEDQWASADVNIRFTEFSQMNVSFQTDMERYEQVDFHKKNLRLEGEISLISWLPFGFEFETGSSIFYDLDDPFLGYRNTCAAFFALKPSKRLRIEWEFVKQTFWEEWGGEEVYDYNVLRQKTTYQISKTLSLRTIIDYNHFSSQIYGSFLLSYILKPGTVFFVGIDNNFLRDDFGRYVQDNYSVFVKFSYWLRM